MVKGHKRHSHEHRNDLAGEYRWGDIGQIIFVIVFIMGLILDLFILRFSESWQNTFPWYYRIFVFIPLLVIAGYFGQKSHDIIFKEERDKLMVIKKDVYARLRHPMYFASILTYLGFVILTLSVISLVIFFMVVIFYYYLCRYEEKILIDKLGNDYKEYMKNVPMLIPYKRIKKG